MLKQRIITACVLLAVLILTLGSGLAWPFVSLIFLFVGAAIWEWMRLLGFASLRAASIAIASDIGLALVYLYGDAPWAGRLSAIVMLVASVIWLILAALLIGKHRFVSTVRYRAVYVVLGVLLPAACCLAIIDAYREGTLFMFSILALVWIADIAAYFSGKAFGKRKLAPAISPGKTWEGVAGAVVAVGLVAIFASHVDALQAIFSTRLIVRYSWLLALPMLALLVGISIVGDLFESHLKRQAGVKDSSALLPGHGGVFDRIDALLPVLPIAVLLSQRWA